MTAVLETLANSLRSAPRLGAESDSPEGARYIQLSDTLARQMAEALELAAEAMRRQAAENSELGDVIAETIEWFSVFEEKRAVSARNVAAYCRELRKQVDATAFHALQSVLSDEPYTQDDIERGKRLIEEHGWDA